MKFKWEYKSLDSLITKLCLKFQISKQSSPACTRGTINLMLSKLIEVHALKDPWSSVFQRSCRVTLMSLKVHCKSIFKNQNYLCKLS